MPPPVLKEYQIPHRDKLRDILQTRYGAIDRSRPGTGKTYTATSVALEMGFRNVIIICEPLAIAKWSLMKEEFGLPILSIITYNKLRSVKGRQPSHGLLDRVDEVTENGISKTSFYPTPILRQLCQVGTFFIVDEIQHITNQNDQSLAVKAITNCLVSEGGASRYLFLSGTYATKEEQIITLLRLLGYIRHPHLYQTKENEGMVLKGAKELIDYCLQLDKKITSDVIARDKIDEQSIRTLCFNLYCEVLMNFIVSSMIKPSDNQRIELICRNLYVNLPQEEALALAEAINELNSVVRYNSGEVDTSELNWGFLIKARHKTEMCKVNAVVRTAEKWLRENPNQKVVVYFNFTEPLEKVKELLSEYSPLVLNGQIRADRREIYRQSFQEANTEHRLLLCNIAVASENIDLDDKDGNFPRKVLIMPDYKIISLHQATYRFLRQDTLSSSYVYFLWGKCGCLESSIIDALARKNAVMKKLHDDQVEQGIKFPGEYENDVEPDLPSLGVGGIWRPEHANELLATSVAEKRSKKSLESKMSKLSI